MTLARATRDQIMADISGAANAFDPAALFLVPFISVSGAGLDLTLADFVFPDGVAVPRQASTPWSAAYDMEDGRIVRDGPLLHFTTDAVANGYVAAGIVAADALVAGNLVDWWLFPEPIAIPDQFHSMGVVYRLTVDPNGRWQSSIDFNG